MKKVIAITLIAGIIITTFAFKSKVITEGEGDFAIMSISGMQGALVISYGNGKSENINFNNYSTVIKKNYMSAIIADGDIIVNQFRKLKSQGYELKSSNGGDHFTTYIFEKK
jgi:hypothetical protein